MIPASALGACSFLLHTVMLITGPGFLHAIRTPAAASFTGLHLEDALASASDASPGSALDMTRTILPNTTYPLARCLDGSAGGYYFRAAPAGSTNRRKFVIYLEGGGICLSPEDCKWRLQGKCRGKDGLRCGSSNDWDPRLQYGNLMSGNRTENEHFFDWNAVYVPYCSGDVYLGQRTEPLLGVYFSGHHILEGVFRHLIQSNGMGAAAEVLLSGGSAGGIGALHHADFLNQMLTPLGVRVKASPQAGYYFPTGVMFYEEFAIGIHRGVEQIAAAYLTVYMDAFLDPSCSAAHPQEEHKCWSADVLYPYIHTPLFLAENKFDADQIYGVLGCKWGQKDNHTAVAFVESYGKLMVSSLQQVLKSPKQDGLFLPACVGHTDDLCTSGGPLVQGVLYADALADWVAGTNRLPHRLLDDCPGDGPCNPKCGCPSEHDQPRSSFGSDHSGWSVLRQVAMERGAGSSLEDWLHALEMPASTPKEVAIPIIVDGATDSSKALEVEEAAEEVAIPVPTPAQLAYQRAELVATVGFQMITYSSGNPVGCTAETWNGDPKLSDPKTMNRASGLNTSQWAEVVQSFGARYAWMDAKHCCGFLLWESNSTLPGGGPYGYDVFAPGALRRDVVREFHQAFAAAGIQPGYYYSVGYNFFLNVGGHSGIVGGNATFLPGMGRVNQAQFEALVVTHLRELWGGRYGTPAEVWFDGGWPDSLKASLKALVHELIPNTVAFGGEGISDNPIKWVGTESGLPAGPIWSTGGGNGRGDPSADVFIPTGCDTVLTSPHEWFNAPGMSVRTLADMIDTYHATVGNNCVLELGFATDTTGVIPADQVTRAKELGDWIKSCYGDPINGGHFVHKSSLVWEIDFGGQQHIIDRVMIQEDIAEGQRVRAYTVQAMATPGSLVMFSNGTSVGHKRIDLGNEGAVLGLRLTVTEHVGDSSNLALMNFAAFAPCSKGEEPVVKVTDW